MDNEIIKSVLDSELAKEAYDDLAAPAARELGTFLGDCLKTAKWLTAPIEFAAAYRDRWLRFLKRVSDKVPEERQVDPAPSIVAPVMNELRYHEEDSPLAGMYVELLARAIDKERQHEAHPAYLKIIQQLSPNEAVLLRKIHQGTIVWHGILNAAGAESNIPRQLPAPDDWRVMVHHLGSLGLVNAATPRRSGGVVDGLNRFQLVLSNWGKGMMKACAPQGEQE